MELPGLTQEEGLKKGFRGKNLRGRKKGKGGGKKN